MLAGDLYHYPEERTAHRFPTFEIRQGAIGSFQVDDRATRDQEHGAKLWIEHDYLHHATLKKSPSYYE